MTDWHRAGLPCLGESYLRPATRRRGKRAIFIRANESGGGYLFGLFQGGRKLNEKAEHRSKCGPLPQKDTFGQEARPGVTYRRIISLIVLQSRRILRTRSPIGDFWRKLEIIRLGAFPKISTNNYGETEKRDPSFPLDESRLFGSRCERPRNDRPHCVAMSVGLSTNVKNGTTLLWGAAPLVLLFHSFFGSKPIAGY